MLSSLVTTTVATFDALVGDLAAAYYRAHPGALGNAPAFSLADLADYDTVDDAREELIRRKADGLDRGIDAIAKWFKDRLDIDLSRLAVDWPHFVEIIQRRHLLVHTGGRVSDLYHKKVAGKSDLAVGATLTVDAEYMQTAIDAFLALEINLIFAVWFDLADDPKQAATNMLFAAQRLAKLGRWRVVSSQCLVAAKLKGPEDVLLHFRVLGWLARKKLDGLASIESEVCAWDVSAL